MRLLFLVIISAFFISGCTVNEEKLAMKAERFHAVALTLDTHCDTPLELFRSDFNLGQRHETGCVDFPRIKEGGLDAEFFAVFIAQGPRTDSMYNVMHQRALEIFDAIHTNVGKNTSMAKTALSVNDAYDLKRDGKIAAFIGVENGYPVGKDISRIKQYHDLGARYITLSHSRNNDICDSSTDPQGPEHGGLSSFGEEVVGEMNRIGMMVDVSHISDDAFYDVLKVTKAPVIASHSSCRALCENRRNLDDNMLLALKENGGVIQICILSNYLKSPEPNPEMEAGLKELRSKYGDYNLLSDSIRRMMREEFRALEKKYEKLATIKDAVDHIDHVVQVAGIDYVGIGTDFDGGGKIEGCRDVSEMKNITIELLRRGYSRKDIEKIWGGNFMRVSREVESLASGASQVNP